MTILIGIICKGAIVLASDSQTTSGGLKRTDAEKITAVKFSTKEILVAQAGNAGNSARAIEILRDLAKDEEISDYRTPADLARSAMIQVKKELRQQYCNCKMTELQDLIWKHELQAELMLAYYFENKPYIFKLDLSVGRADKENSWYAALGCGANLGSYLLTEYTKPEMSSGLAAVIACYVVEDPSGESSGGTRPTPDVSDAATEIRLVEASFDSSAVAGAIKSEETDPSPQPSPLRKGRGRTLRAVIRATCAFFDVPADEGCRKGDKPNVTASSAKAAARPNKAALISIDINVPFVLEHVLKTWNWRQDAARTRRLEACATRWMWFSH